MRLLQTIKNSKSLLLFGLAVPFGACAQELGWEVVDGMIEGDFPEVRRISTDSLAHWLGDTALDLPRLIDVRAEEEYRISHIKGAIRISPDAEVFPELQGIDSAAPIVLYCSVGYRSARLAELLEREGFSNVMNLQGSIFQWANEGRPLYQNGELVEKVHEYDRVWGVLLDGEYWRE